ncbi:MAG TPA: hypothetical protein VL633_02155 [Bacteroidota bacterium]|jgi:hypothetical protein|nr:hypothetical protein [Bacteroidota bacterium]
MKIKIFIAVLAAALFGFQSLKHADFSGAWQLDLKKSENLPESFKNIDSFIMNIRQTRDSIVTVASMKGMGQDVKLPFTAYALNGNEVFRADTARKSARWIKASWKSGGKHFVVDSRVEQHVGTPELEKYSQSDTWELTDANTLQISVLQKTPEGKEKHTERRVFHRAR